MRDSRAVFPGTVLFVLTAAFFTLCSPLAAMEAVSHGNEALLGKYQSLKKALEKNQFGLPVYLESHEEESSLRVDVYDVIDYPFESVSTALTAPSGWCDFTFLHLNTKACTYRKDGSQWMVKLYNGRKHYEPPEDADTLDLAFSVASRQPQYFRIALTAGEGPFLTRDHSIALEAVPLDKTRTFVHFSHAYRYGTVARMAIKSYFATLGRGKIGFSVIGTDGKGDPEHVEGVRGALERNAVRYYLALEVYMETLGLKEDQRFEKAIARWYDLTEKFPKQLHEVGREEYLAAKRRERANQQVLQKNEGKRP